MIETTPNAPTCGRPRADNASNESLLAWQQMTCFVNQHKLNAIQRAHILRRVVVTVMLVLCAGCGPRVHRPRSDVPVIANIGFWPGQEHLRIDDLTVTVVDAPLNLFNSKALVRFRIKGSIANTNDWRPYIKKVQISQRAATTQSIATVLTTQPHGGLLLAPRDLKYGDLLLVPIVDVRQDSKYTGEEVSFDIKVEQLIETLRWGSNRYVVVAGDKQTEFTLDQSK